EHPGGGHVQARRRVARPLVGRERLRRDGAEAGRVAVARQLVAVPEGPRGGDDRVRQPERPELQAGVASGHVRSPAPAGHHTSNRSCWSRWYSCSDRTWGSLAAHSARPDATASAAATVVTHETRCTVAARRM